MGLILDSSILMAGERGGESVRAILPRVQASQGQTESGLSAVIIVELTHAYTELRAILIVIADELLLSNCAVATLKVRHFRLIPSLSVIQL